MRRFVTALVLALLAAAGGLVWALLRPGPPHAVELRVPPGTPATAVLERLHDEGLLPAPLVGRLYLRIAGSARGLRFGVYHFAPRTTPRDALDRLLRGEVETVSVTVPEGADLAQVMDIFIAAGLGDRTGWQKALTRTGWIADLAPNAPSLEGFLFPDTYLFAAGTDAATAAHHLVERFHKVWSEESERAGGTWGTPLQVTTLASLVEAETAVPDERPRIAGVFLNRLRRGMLLQCDPTVVYALKREGLWRGSLRRADLAIDDAYNTYRYPGLPPGPIDSPGRLALRAALAPEHTSFLYFVASPSGGHQFSATLQEHNRAVARLRKSRR